MKKVLFFVVLMAISLPCLALSFPPSSPKSDNLVYSFYKSKYDNVTVRRSSDLGWYSWSISGDLLTVLIITNEAQTFSGTKEVHAYSRPAGYTSSVLTIYFVSEGNLWKREHDFRPPSTVPENRADWTAYFKTTDDFYNYWEKGKPPKQEVE